MIKMKKILLSFLFITSLTSEASISGARKIHQSGDKSRYPQMVSELIKDKMYFSSIPFIKEYLSTTSRINDSAVDKVLDELITEVGVKQFEVLPANILENQMHRPYAISLPENHFDKVNTTRR